MKLRSALAGLVLLLAAGCSAFEGTGEKGYLTTAGKVVQFDVAERKPPVELTGEDLAGNPVDLASLRGKPVVVVVWGAWCPPCREEAPELVEAAKELGDSVRFLGINLREPGTASGAAFERTFEIPYPSVHSPTGEALLPFAGTLTLNSIPSLVVLDAEGRPAASIIGTLPSTLTLVDLARDVSAEGKRASKRG